MCRGGDGPADWEGKEGSFQGMISILYFDQSGSEVVKIHQAEHLRLDFIKVTSQFFKNGKKTIFPFGNMGHKTDHVESIIYLNDLFEEALKCLPFLRGGKMC